MRTRPTGGGVCVCGGGGGRGGGEGLMKLEIVDIFLVHQNSGLF